MNPFGAVVPQNKRTMALMWEAIDRFSPESQEAIRRYLPYTVQAGGDAIPRCSPPPASNGCSRATTAAKAPRS